MKYKIFIICILTGLFIPLLALVSCNSEHEKTEGDKFPTNTQNEAEKQVIVDKLITSIIIPAIKTNIDIYNSTTWDETAEAYDISGANQLFDVIEYDNAQSQKTKYNGNDDESKTTRREMYLSLHYISSIIKAFGALANKMVAAKNAQMKTELENMVDKLRKQGKAFYFTAYNTLITKQDKLLKLDLSDLQTLKVKFDAINSANKKIYPAFVKPITNDYYKNIEIGTAKHTLQDNATAGEIQTYLKDKFNSAEPHFNTIINEATDIANILKKI
ncbi:CRASP family complement regulator-acquiring lipoprotein [Borrelia hermsii]|uniref:Lipoprotein n=2 Tax=Borrelia hermsii TaxID=140 RepID=T1EC74_BORHE|nr:CRASP family complement regulator-acquiring lipoprotein [Borrelia hermsii]ADN26278.2 hypothetical protein BHA019 [Borrelia hermsii]AMR75854.1 hypothetical protein A0V01_04390 [Borrelia hermsii]ANA43659.1 putative lipoprotein [Borrelia hermsii HS1]UPA08453.1 hypothetical protein bhDAH_001161 [Borrelia hermsii DAH]